MVLLLRQRLLTECDSVKHYFDPVIDFSARFRRLRDTLQLSQEQMAARLHISANYLSQIENGREPSMRVLEACKRLEQDVIAAQESDRVTLPESMPGHVGEAPAHYGSIDLIRQELRQKLERTIGAAGDDRDRLGWISVQLETHLRPPPQWIDDAAAVTEAKRLLAAVKVRDQGADRTQRSG